MAYGRVVRAVAGGAAAVVKAKAKKLTQLRPGVTRVGKLIDAKVRAGEERRRVRDYSRRIGLRTTYDLGAIEQGVSLGMSLSEVAELVKARQIEAGDFLEPEFDEAKRKIRTQLSSRPNIPQP